MSSFFQNEISTILEGKYASSTHFDSANYFVDNLGDDVIRLEVEFIIFPINTFIIHDKIFKNLFEISLDVFSYTSEFHLFTEDVTDIIETEYHQDKSFLYTEEYVKFLSNIFSFFSRYLCRDSLYFIREILPDKVLLVRALSIEKVR